MEGEREERYRKSDNTVRSTGGAVKVRNAKGEVVMEKVKVTRYFAKRPAWVQERDDDESSDDQDAMASIARAEEASAAVPQTASASLDRRLKRLEEMQTEAATGGRRRRDRRVEAAVEEDSDDSDKEPSRPSRHRPTVEAAVVEDESDGEESDGEVERRRQRMRERARARAATEADGATDESAAAGGAAHPDELPVVDDAVAEEESESEESESEYETDSDSDGPSIAPVFVSKTQRDTIREREAREAAEAAAAEELEKKAQARVAAARDLVVKTIQDEINAEHRLAEHEIDDEDNEFNEEEEFAAWKVRELTRIKRDQDKRAAEEAERAEIERLRSMTEEERLEALKKREKKVTNAQAKGKMKFMQKYYHRGAFFMDEDEELYKRDVTAPTGDDNFDKAVLPKAMQVRKDQFGKMSRTKYTHLADQDTSAKDSPWSQQTPLAARIEKKRGGTGNVFERPSSKRRKDK